MNTKFTLKFIAALLTISYSCLSIANDQLNQNNADQPRKPPQEAFTACEGKSEGDKVSFTTPRGDTLDATCISIQAGLVARPDHRPQGAKGGKPERNKPQ